MSSIGSSGGLEWGIFRKLVEYVESVPDGAVELSEGAYRTDSGEFGFLAGTQDAETASFIGRVTLSAYEGMLRVVLLNPTVLLDPAGGGVLTENPYRAGDLTTIATLGPMTVEAGSYSAPATLTSAGTGWLSDGRYPVGQDVDPVRWRSAS